MHTSFRTASARVLQPLSAFLFPPVCLSCGKRRQGACKVCDACAALMRRVGAHDPALRQLTDRLLGEPVIADVIALYVFDRDGPVQAMVHQLKYGGWTKLGVEWGYQLGEAVRGWASGAPFDAVLPVPLHRAKLRERGYNQSECLARGVAAALHLPLVPHLLCRHRFTATQTALESEERTRNVEGAFSLAGAQAVNPRGKKFLLVDDVITTGATLRSCARVLYGAGAQPVVCCAVAIAP